MSEEQAKQVAGKKSEPVMETKKLTKSSGKETSTKGKLSKQTEPKAKGRVLTLLVGVVLLIGLALLAFMYFEQAKAIAVLYSQQNEFVQTLTLQKTESVTELNSVQSRVDDLSEQLLQSASLLDEQNIELDRINREVIGTRLRISESGSNNQVWTLTEAQSLLRLAGQRLVIAQDVRSALALMVASDDILKQINDPAIFSIRNILASDLAAVRAIEEIDVEGMYFQLGGILGRIDAAPLVSVASQQLQSAEQINLMNESENLEAGFFSKISSALFRSINTYFVVRKTNEPIQPMINVEEAHYIKEMIKLELEQARLSLLQGQEEIYYSSLSQSLESIKRYLEMNNERQSIEQALEDLQERPIKIVLPVVSNSLLALQQIMPLTGEQNGGEE